MEDQLRFETLVAALATRFINLPPEKIDGEIAAGIRCVVEHLGLDRGGGLQWTEEHDGLAVTHVWARAGVDPVPRGLRAEEFPWLLARALDGEVSSFRSVDDLPPEAERDRAGLRRFGAKSGLVLPLASSSRLLGALVLDTTRDERDWPPSLVAQLDTVAHIFADALERKRLDLALRRANAEVERLRDLLQAENRYLREEARRGEGGGRIVGRSAAIQRVLSLVEQVAPTAAPVLLTGETGVGKELVAEVLHDWSPRRERTLVKVNCAALLGLPPTTLETRMAKLGIRRPARTQGTA